MRALRASTSKFHRRRGGHGSEVIARTLLAAPRSPRVKICTITIPPGKHLLSDNFRHLTDAYLGPKIPKIKEGRGSWAGRSATPAFRPTIYTAKPKRRRWRLYRATCCSLSRNPAPIGIGQNWLRP